MHSSHSVTIDNRGRLTIPAALRESAGLKEGTELIQERRHLAEEGQIR